MSFRVRLTREAGADLDRLYDFVLERQAERDGGNLAPAERALAAVRAGTTTLKTSPFTCRKAGLLRPACASMRVASQATEEVTKMKSHTKLALRAMPSTRIVAPPRLDAAQTQRTKPGG